MNIIKSHKFHRQQTGRERPEIKNEFIKLIIIICNALPLHTENSAKLIILLCTEKKRNLYCTN